jgi:hypothetical protein
VCVARATTARAQLEEEGGTNEDADKLVRFGEQIERLWASLDSWKRSRISGAIGDAHAELQASEAASKVEGGGPRASEQALDEYSARHPATRALRPSVHAQNLHRTL